MMKMSRLFRDEYLYAHVGLVALITCGHFEYGRRRDEDARKEAIRRDDHATKRDEDARREAIQRDDHATKREEHARKQDIKRDIRKEYSQIAELETLARKACKDATGSSCTSAEDFIRFAEIYARSRAIERQTLPRPWFRFGFHRGTLSSAQLEHVERYRKTFNSYFTNTYDFHDRAVQPFYPSKGEFEAYLTFHWTLTMANAICAEKKKLWAPLDALAHPKTYDLMLDAIQAQQDEERYRRVVDIQSAVRNKLLDIRSNLFQGAQED